MQLEADEIALEARKLIENRPAGAVKPDAQYGESDFDDFVFILWR